MSRDAAFDVLVMARAAEGKLWLLYNDESRVCEDMARALVERRAELSTASAVLTAAHEAYIAIAREEADQAAAELVALARLVK